MRRELWIHALGAKVGGGLTYLRAILPELAAQLDGRGVRVVVLLPAPLDVAVPGWVEMRVIAPAASNALTRVLFDQFVLPLWLARRRGAVLYCSGSFSPLVQPVPTIALLRNAIYWDADFLGRELPVQRTIYRLQEKLIASGARRCAAVHYPSRSMRDLVESHHPELSSRGLVNAYGIGDRFAGAARPNTPESRADRPTFLYVLTYTLQKNLTYLLRALALAKEEGIRVRAVVTCDVGSGPPSCFETDRAIIDSHDLIGSGYLDAVGSTYGERLLELYRRVDACVFPSFCESFGHPLVEALALGKPLVCADKPYARELCGEHAVYVDADRPEDLVRVWREWPASALGVEPADRAGLLDRFSWPAHVARLLQSFGLCAA